MLSLDEDEGKLALTLRPSDLKLSDTSCEHVPQMLLSHFQDFISERATILEELKLRSGGKENSIAQLAQAFVPGGRVSGHVVALSDESAVVELEQRVRGKINRASMHGLQQDLSKQLTPHRFVPSFSRSSFRKG